MANKRDNSRQKRARQNRAQREALKARTTAASVPAPERAAKATGSSAGAGATSKAAPARGGLFGGGRERPLRPGDRPVDLDSLEGNWFSKRMQVPGGRQVLTGTLLTIIVTGLMAVWQFPSADAPMIEASVNAVGEVAEVALEPTPVEEYPADQRLWEVLGPPAFAVLLVPLAAMLASSWATLRPYRRKVWIGSSFLVAVVVMMGFIMYLFPVGFLTFAVWRAAKVEGPMRAQRQASRSADEAPEGEDEADQA